MLGRHAGAVVLHNEGGVSLALPKLDLPARTTPRPDRGLALNADGTITDADGNIVGGSATIIEGTPGEDLPALDVNDPNVHVGPVGSGTVSGVIGANSNVTTDK